MEAFNLEAPTIENPEPTPGFCIYAPNWNAVKIFMVVHTQFKRIGLSGHYDGLDYQAVESGMRMAGLSATPEDFSKLRELEKAYADERNLMIQEASA